MMIESGTHIRCRGGDFDDPCGNILGEVFPDRVELKRHGRMYTVYPTPNTHITIRCERCGTETELYFYGTAQQEELWTI